MDLKIFKSDFLNLIIESIYLSNQFDSKGEMLVAMRTFILLNNTFDLDEYATNHHFTEDEYKIYYKDVLKEYNPTLNKRAKKEFKNKRREK